MHSLSRNIVLSLHRTRTSDIISLDQSAIGCNLFCLCLGGTCCQQNPLKPQLHELGTLRLPTRPPSLAACGHDFPRRWDGVTRDNNTSFCRRRRQRRAALSRARKSRGSAGRGRRHVVATRSWRFPSLGNVRLGAFGRSFGGWFMFSERQFLRLGLPARWVILDADFFALCLTMRSAG